MQKKLMILLFVVALLVVAAVPAFADGPNFGPAVYADGVAWGTKGTTSLPAPNANNAQSYDGIFAFTNGVEGQLPVAEAAPTNPAYNGGRWSAHSVTWNTTPELVTSYAQLMALQAGGALSITPAGNYFQCPLLPVH